MRVMETALQATAKTLGIAFGRDWGDYLRRIEIVLKSTPPGHAFFADVSAHLHSVKTAWRNPTMHVDRDYTTEQAGDIFAAVSTFMRHLAAKVHE
jgi:hypothetical protein